MSRVTEIEANDALRHHFRGGRIEVCHGPYEIDDRTMGRMLCALAAYDRFPGDSLHDEGLVLFAGSSSPGKSKPWTARASCACGLTQTCCKAREQWDRKS